jgi:hypothetical protein
VDFLLDENTDPRIGVSLRRNRPEINVLEIGSRGAPALGTLDPEILVWCEMHRYGLVTANRSSMPMHLKAHLDCGRHVPGIFVFSVDLSIGEIANDLLLIFDAAQPGEFEDQIVYLPL